MSACPLAPNLPQTRDEVRVLRSLAHPNIIQYHDCFVDGGVQYIAMEYAEVHLLSLVCRSNRHTGAHCGAAEPSRAAMHCPAQAPW